MAAEPALALRRQGHGRDERPGELYIAGGHNGRALAKCYAYVPDDPGIDVLSGDPNSAGVIFIDTIGPTPDDDPPPRPGPPPVPRR